jgi:hypothetical protein
MVTVPFDTKACRIGGPCAAKIDEYEAARVAGHNDVLRLNVPVSHLLLVMQFADGRSQAINQAKGLPRLDGGPAASADMPQVLGKTDALRPCQCDIDVRPASVPIDDTGERIVFEPTQHTQLLFHRRASRPSLYKKEIAAGPLEWVER